MTKHVPHVVVGAPWDEDDLRLSVVQLRHLNKVLRLGIGDPITYTDGLGRVGSGKLGHVTVRRGEEKVVARPSNLTLAVAPPANKDRLRFMVEKLAELGVARLRWMTTRHGKERVPTAPKVFSWVLSAVEQSQGAWLMETSDELVAWDDLEPPVVVCHPGDGVYGGHPKTLVIGPEGGFGDDEIPGDLARHDLGPTILRTETAAIVAAARFIGN